MFLFKFYNSSYVTQHYIKGQHWKQGYLLTPFCVIISTYSWLTWLYIYMHVLLYNIMFVLM